tara:strand:+ start:604 stop:843 length:240 start_codon:yes stop_codon:yes gene_type:complete
MDIKLMSESSQHLYEQRTTWKEHCRFSFYLSYLLAIASCKAIIHALIPALFKTSTTDACKHIQIEIKERSEEEDAHLFI